MTVMARQGLVSRRRYEMAADKSEDKVRELVMECQ